MKLNNAAMVRTSQYVIVNPMSISSVKVASVLIKAIFVIRVMIICWFFFLKEIYMIHVTIISDIDCPDGSDETNASCTRKENDCNGLGIVKCANISACIMESW